MQQQFEGSATGELDDKSIIHNRTKQINWLRNYYDEMYKISNHINSIFEWSNVALIMLSFYSIVTFLNFIYSQIVRRFLKYQSGLLIFRHN